MNPSDFLLAGFLMLLTPAGASRSVNTAAGSVHDFTMTTNSGKPLPLSEYKGKVLLIVNVASKCGYTPQYSELEGLYQRYKDRGLVIAAFPANNFGGQEPGTDEEIAAFCTTNYDVTFPLFSKISVEGKDQHPLYHFLTDAGTNKEYGGKVKWNFTKFLVGKDGRVIGRFEPRVKPLSDEMVKAVEKQLRDMSEE